MAYASLVSPFGDLTVFVDDGFIVALEWGRAAPGEPGPREPGLGQPDAGVEAAVAALRRYFDGERTAFDGLAVRPMGSDFRRRVWDRLRAIPYGATTSYGALAGELATAPRAIAGACAGNPIPLIIPCHRVVGASGALSGYSGGEGIATKSALLALEGAIPPTGG